MINRGVSESAKSKGEYKLLRITDIKNNAVDWNTVPYTDYDEHLPACPQFQSCQLEEGLYRKIPYC